MGVDPTDTATGEPPMLHHGQHLLIWHLLRCGQSPEQFLFPTGEAAHHEFAQDERMHQNRPILVEQVGQAGVLRGPCEEPASSRSVRPEYRGDPAKNRRQTDVSTSTGLMDADA
jgi:hypothetical protein